MYDLSKLYMNFEKGDPKMPIREKFPELNGFSEFMECTDDMIKIAILIGDIDSPFVRIRDREVMVRTVFEYLNIDVKTNKSMFERVVAYRHPKIMGAWLRYLQILHETEFTNWQLCRKDFDFFLAQTNDIKMDKEGEISYYKRRNIAREQVRELGAEMRRIEAKLFPDSKAAREAAIIEQGLKISLWAEKYAEENTYI